MHKGRRWRLNIKVKERPFVEGSKITHVLEIFILNAIEVLKIYILRDVTRVNFVCNNFYMLVYCTYYIALCWQYPWDIFVESWKPVLKLKSSYVLIDAFYLEYFALWVNSYAKLFYACLESTIHEKVLLIWLSCLFIIYLLATIDYCLGSLHS